jgi:cytochrome P450
MDGYVEGPSVVVTDAERIPQDIAALLTDPKAYAAQTPVFEAPGRFLCDRRDNRQISFGYGVHLRLRMHLARMKMRLLSEELPPHVGTLELAGPRRRSEATFIGGLKSLPIRLTTW